MRVRPVWKPMEARESEKLDKLTPNLIQRPSNKNKGTTAKMVKASETIAGGRFSGCLNKWLMTGNGSYVNFIHDGIDLMDSSTLGKVSFMLATFQIKGLVMVASPTIRLMS